MANASWEEIKSLAIDLKKAQLSSTSQNISERNCVEVVNRLIDLGLIEVYHTSDGKSFITPDMVVKEVNDELVLHRGRVNLVDLQQSINIAFSHIEAKVSEMIRNDSSLVLILGQLLTKDYLNNVCREVNDVLNEQGYLKVSDIIKQYDLPTDFLREEVVEAGLKSGTIQAIFEGEVLYTKSYIARDKAQIRGYLSAAIRPITLNVAQQHLNIPSKLFNSLLDELLAEGRLKGSLSSGHGTFVPECYSRVQMKWLENFFSQNNYVEFSALKRVANVANPKQLVSKVFPKAVFLNTCAVDESMMTQLESAVDECMRNGSWVDIGSHLPVCADSSDLHTAAQTLMKRHPSAQLLGEGVFVSPGCSDRCRNLFNELMAEQAVKDIREKPALLMSALGASGGSVDHGREESDSKSKGGKNKGGKSGGGFQGREIKAKAVKKKYLAGKGNVQESGDSDLVPFMSVSEISEVLKPALGEDAPEEFVEEMAESLQPTLVRAYQDVLKSAFIQTSGTAKKRSSHSSLQEKLTRMTQHLYLAEKALDTFCTRENDKQLRESLEKSLVKSLGNEITNEVCAFVADDFNYEEWPKPDKPAAITNEMRLKLLNNVTDEKLLGALRSLFVSLQKGDLRAFYSDIDRVAGELSIMTKKADRKKEKQLAVEIAAQLSSDLDSMESNPALLLLSTCCLLFQSVTGLPLNIPGRHVPNIITWLQGKIPPEVHADLLSYQDLVVQKLKQTSGDDAKLESELASRFEELTPRIKTYASGWKKIKTVEEK